MSFSLHPKLAADTHLVADLALCRVLLMDDARYPWLILVPRRPALREVYDLPQSEQAQLWAEVTRVGQALMRQFEGDKLNIATLGNQVPQLHVHVIVRRETDPAWPGPVWGQGASEQYSADQLTSTLASLRALLVTITENPRNDA